MSREEGRTAGRPSVEKAAVEGKRQFLGLDVIRLMAALMVACYHLAYHQWRPGRTPLATYSEAFEPIKPIVSSGWVGVPIFFVISGFVIAFSAEGKSAVRFIQGRASRLYPAAWVCATITLLAVGGTLAQYLRSVSLFPIGPWVDGVYWTLAIEVIFYAVVALCLALQISRVKLALALGLYSTAFWGAKIANALAGGPFDWMFQAIENDEGFLLLAHDGCFFALGMLLWEGRRRRYMLLFAGVGFVAILLRSHAITPYDAAPFYVAPLIWSMATSLIILSVKYGSAIQALAGSHRRVFRTLGLMTYPLYLVHQEVGGKIMLGLTGLGPWGALGIGMTAVISLALATVPIEIAIKASWRRRLA